MKLGSRYHLRYIVLVAIGFFWCGSSYLSQEMELTRCLTDHMGLVNVIAIGIGSFAMAAGILLFALFYKLRVNIKRLFLVFLSVCAVLNILFWFTDSIWLKGAVLVITCMIGTAGYGAGYHFALLGSRVPKGEIGRCFATGYALGAIGTYILTIIPKVDLFSSAYSLFIYIPMITANLFLIQKIGDIAPDEEAVGEKSEEKPERIEGKTIIALGVMVAIMAVLSNYSAGFLDFLMKGNLVNVVFNRAFYALGLITAGILADKNRKALEFTTIFSLLFSLIVCVFIQEGISAGIMQLFYYLLLGFFVVFRTIFFIDLGQRNSKYLALAGVGLAISAVIEGLYTFVVEFLIANYLAVILILVLLFMLLFLYYYFRYDRAMRDARHESAPENKTREERLEEFCNRYSLTRREEEVLRLLLEKRSGKEIADELSITLGTVKNVASKIYKKTEMKKDEILKRLNG